VVTHSLLHRVAERVRRKRRFSWVNERFRRFSQGTSRAFVFAVMLCLGWGVAGPIFHYSEPWQFFINDLTNIITFLAVFLIQNTQNRDAKAIHLKLDELLRAVEGARSHMIDLQDLGDDELDYLERQFRRLRKRETRKADAAADVAADLPASDLGDASADRLESTSH
jgi:low affinity Fe/Cu permease